MGVLSKGLARFALSSGLGRFTAVGLATVPFWAFAGASFDGDFTTHRYLGTGVEYSTMAALDAAKGGPTYARASVGTRFNSLGVLEDVAADVMRFDYDPLTLAPLGWLCEGEARTNLCPQSDIFGVGSNLLSAVKNVIGPDGVANSATTLIENSAAAAEHFADDVNISGTTVGAVYTFSFFAKAGVGSRCATIRTTTAKASSSHFDLTAGAWVGAGAGQDSRGFQKLPNGWYRLWVTVTIATAGTLQGRVQLSTSAAATVYDGDGVSSILVALRQLELGAYASSPIRTSGAAVERKADLPIGLTYANSGEHTLYVEARALGVAESTVRTIMALDLASGSVAERSSIRTGAAGPSMLVVDDNVIGVNNGYGIPLLSSFQKIVSTVGVNDHKGFSNGVQIGQTATAVTMPTTDRISIGGNGGLPAGFMGHIKRFAVFPRKLSAAEVAALDAAG
jgi:hypothetical protein